MPAVPTTKHRTGSILAFAGDRGARHIACTWALQGLKTRAPQPSTRTYMHPQCSTFLPGGRNLCKSEAGVADVLVVALMRRRCLATQPSAYQEAWHGASWGIIEPCSKRVELCAAWANDKYGDASNPRIGDVSDDVGVVELSDSVLAP